LAAASFWIYLVHHPILGLVQLDLKWLVPGANPVAKTAAAFLIASGFSLLSYEGLVRRTALGRLLGFSWEAPSKRDQYESVLSIDSLKAGHAAADEMTHKAA
jgi:peptidoglycan/LPS O-acetylase OafA/YrhL